MKRNRTQWRDNLSQTSWQDFERLLARHYREQGFDVEHAGTAEAASRFDGGVDLVLRRDGESVLVQCKHWNAAQVPHNEVHQLLGIVETRGATRAILITSGEFTFAAREAASRSSRIELIDGSELRLMVDPHLIPDQLPRQAVAAVSDRMEWAPVAEKAIDAIMTIQTRGRWGKRRKDPEQELKELALRIVFAAVIVLVAFVFIRSQINKLQDLTSRPVSRPAAAAPVQSTRPNPQPVASQPAYVAPPSKPLPRTPEEIEEWERKNAESMKILERTTPSVYD